MIKFGRDTSLQAQIGSVKQQHCYKVVVVGDSATGKTSIIDRYVDSTFSPFLYGTVSSN